jgi:aryl-alcohol dehydrogenase-like predicted oxidoreductase
MNTRKLGRTNLYVSELGLDISKLNPVDESSAFAFLDTYYESGGTFLQSSGATPAVPVGQDQGEEVIGRWLGTRGIDRNGLVLASRMSFARPAHGGSIAFVNSIREACEQSLRRLRTKHLDLLVCAWHERLTPFDDLLEAMDMLTRAGCVRHAVAGAFPSWRVVDSIHRSFVRDHARFEALQAHYSLVSRSRRESETFAMCREHRLGFLAESPLAEGYLAQRAPLLFGGGIADPILAALAEIAGRRSATPAQIALAWVLQNPQVAAAVNSPATVGELTDLLRAAAICLSADEMATLASAAVTQHLSGRTCHF